jgi:hypothetical protein
MINPLSPTREYTRIQERTSIKHGSASLIW